jgi:hypothetical protein
MGASLRVIKIVKDPMTNEEAYTIEFEVEAEEARELMSELAKCPLGSKLNALLDQAQFLPDENSPSAEEIRKREEEEEKLRQEREVNITNAGIEEGRRQTRIKYIDYLRTMLPQLDEGDLSKLVDRIEHPEEAKDKAEETKDEEKGQETGTT